MMMYKIVDLKTLAKELINSNKNNNEYEIDIATDFNIDYKIGDIVDEDNVGHWYQCKKIYMADSVYIACVYYGGSIGDNILFDINLKYEDDLEEMAIDLASCLKEYLDIYDDNLVAIQIFN